MVLWLDHGKQIALSGDAEGICKPYKRSWDKEIELVQAQGVLGCSKKRGGRPE